MVDGKARKGWREAKIKKGAKRKKGKKGKIKNILKKEPPKVIEQRPPTPTIVYIEKFEFEKEKDFFSFMIGLKIKQPTYVLFFAKESDMEKQAFEGEINTVYEFYYSILKFGTLKN